MGVAAKSDSCQVIIDVKRCKGCGLCADVCPKHLIQEANELSVYGDRTYEFVGEDECTGCSFCALMCPDVAIIIRR